MKAMRSTRNPSLPMFGRSLRDVHVHAVDHRHHGDQRGGGQDDPEQSQEAAQLARPQRVQGDGGGFEKRGLGTDLHGKMRIRTYL